MKTRRLGWKIAKVLVTAIAVLSLATARAQANTIYQLDNNTILYPLNASDGTEPRDNWFGNVFTAQAGGNLITRVDFGVFTTAGTPADVVLYRVTDPGGNPALGATRVYTQAFTPLTGDGTNAFLQQITLTTPVLFNPGDLFLVAIFIPDVIGLPPNDVYPYLLDTSGIASGSFWDRSDPNTFNLDDLSSAKPVDQQLAPGGWTPGPGHIFIRAYGIESAAPIPEPSTVVLLGTSLLGLAGAIKRKLLH